MFDYKANEEMQLVALDRPKAGASWLDAAPRRQAKPSGFLYWLLSLLDLA